MKPYRVLTTILILVIVVAASSVAFGQGANKTPKFSAADRDAIDGYYRHLHGTQAPGSLDRKGFPPDVDRGLAVGAKLPAQLEKQLENLPEDLESKLSRPPAGYWLYKLGNHVLVLRRSDQEIADIIKNAGWK